MWRGHVEHLFASARRVEHVFVTDGPTLAKVRTIEQVYDADDEQVFDEHLFVCPDDPDNPDTNES